MKHAYTGILIVAALFSGTSFAGDESKLLEMNPATQKQLMSRIIDRDGWRLGGPSRESERKICTAQEKAAPSCSSALDGAPASAASATAGN